MCAYRLAYVPGLFIVSAMNIQAMNDDAVLTEIGRRVQVHRLNLNMTQAAVAEQAGVSRRVLQKLESGKPCSLAIMVRVLRTLGKLDTLDSFLPEMGPSPLQLAKLKGRERKRASGGRT